MQSHFSHPVLKCLVPSLECVFVCRSRVLYYTCQDKAYYIHVAVFDIILACFIFVMLLFLIVC